ncbi:hypothetical protein PF005_g21144 [Phytophthora fragariae]|uniref:Uncharacterized protein n=2 Tax=Phytophthora fragariae TaxID=53985 RepID=A0A6A3J067_9STRA|nr:hypothetical protein PF011_g19594 [Phytophthora fragariae]KAE9185716.1 hypothetical protein PF005_g21144 [Phytophthora fragariae]
MEKLMDHCGNVAAERKLRTPGSKVRGWWRGGEVGGGVRARAWQAAAGQQQAAARLVAASELEHGKLRLASGKVRGRLVACMALVASLTMDPSCFCMLQRRRARVTEDGGGVRAADRMLQLPSSKRSPARVTEDCGGVRAADGNLPLPSRRFMTPEVGRSWRY